MKYDEGTSRTSVVNHLKFDSFGQITAVEDGAGNPSTLDPQLSTLLYAYTGRLWDSDSELYYYRARWYDAPTGRFISEDPSGFAAGDPNLSRYVGNSPTNAADPSGLRRVPLRSNRLNLLYLEEHPEIAAMMAVMNSDLPDSYGSTPWWWWLPDDWAGSLADPETTVGQLLAGDIYGNQIWGDPGIALSFMEGPISTPVGPIQIGGGVEFIYDWSNNGKPGTGLNIFVYPQIGASTLPSTSANVSVVNVYNFSPKEYQGPFLNGAAAVAIPPYGGPSAGFSFTPKGADQWTAGKPVTQPYAYYAGWQIGEAPSLDLSYQHYFPVYGPENAGTWIGL